MKKNSIIFLIIVMFLSFIACNDKSISNGDNYNETTGTNMSSNPSVSTSNNGNSTNSVPNLSSDLSYQINDDGLTCTIIGIGDNKDEKLYIPTQIDNYTVTAIKEGAFNGCTILTEVTIPESVIEIGDVIFNGCKNLKKIVYLSSYKSALPFYIQYDYDLGFKMVETIEYGAETLPERFFLDTPRIVNLILNENVKNIEAWAFVAADGVDNLTISASVTNIAPNAFAGLKANSIQINQENEFYECRNNCLINKKNKELVIGTAGSEIPDDGSVTRIGAYAFAGLSIEKLNIPNTVLSIGEMAFSSCDKLHEIIIPSSVVSIEEKAFCLTNFKNIKVDTMNPVYHSEGNCLIDTATKTIIAGCENSVIPADESVERIGAAAFYGLHPSNMILPKTITQIDDYAFYVWEDLESQVFYEGSIDDFKKIFFGEHCEFLYWSTIYIYSETTPSKDEYEYYWRYDTNGTVSIWANTTSDGIIDE